MQDNIKNKVVVILFGLIIYGFFFLNLVAPDKKSSVSERRKLEQFPKVSLKAIISGDFFKKFDSYSMDQFYQREKFRKLKIKTDMLVLGNYNNMQIDNDYIYEALYPLNENSVNNLVSKINNIIDSYLDDTNKVYYSLIPDKGYYINNSLKLDYTKLVSLYKSVKGNYIDLFNILSLDDYYKSDTHWKEENLLKVAKELARKMDFTIDDNISFKDVVGFNGVYGSRLVLDKNLDKIVVAENAFINNAVVYDLTSNKKIDVYNYDKINSLDKYDIYLNGASGLLKIDNLLDNNGKRLIIFRDSYTSSLAPLLISGYKEIILVDTRYISPKILNNYINFKDADILFLYGALMANNSYTIR